MNKSKGYPISGEKHYISITTKVDALPPDNSPSTQPQPFIPLLAPSPLGPFINDALPKLSGVVNFSSSACQCETLR